MKRLILSLATVLIFIGAAIAGESLSPQDENAIKDAGLTVYPGAVVLAGHSAMGFQFATSDSVNKVRNWYQEKNSAWTVFDDGSMWVLYNGKPGLNPWQIMSKPQVLIDSNENLPLIHGLDKNMTTEIVLIPLKP